MKSRAVVKFGFGELDGLQFEIVEEVLSFPGVPADEARRKRFRHLLEMASKTDPNPEKIEKHGGFKNPSNS